MLTLDDLEFMPSWSHTAQAPKKPVSHHKWVTHKKSKTINLSWWEVGKVGIVILVSFLVGNIVTNAWLYSEKINEFINGIQETRIGATSDTTHFDQSSKKVYLSTLFKTQNAHKNKKEDIYKYYKNRPQTLDFQFNTLPPDRRIIIPELGIQAPIVNVDGDVPQKMKDGEFTEELKQGVVHYPTTPWPEEPGTTMIVWHTSNYFWIKSAYNTVFSKIPQLKVGQTIQLIWDGKMYEYEVKEQEIVKPKDVPQAYAQNFDHTVKRLAIMWCYPIGTRDKRMIIFAEPKKTTQDINHKYAANTYPIN